MCVIEVCVCEIGVCVCVCVCVCTHAAWRRRLENFPTSRLGYHGAGLGFRPQAQLAPAMTVCFRHKVYLR